MIHRALSTLGGGRRRVVADRFSRPMHPSSRHPDLRAHLAAQHALARQLMGAGDLDRAAPTFLAIVGELLGWDVGALWEVPEAGAGALELVGTWEAEGLDAAGFWERCRELTCRPGVGIPGRTWESGELTWAAALREEANFPRREAALGAGLEGGLAIPVPIGESSAVLAVAEFFTSAFESPDESVVALLVGFTDQLAMFITRQRAEQHMRRSENLKSAILASTPDAVIGMSAAGEVIEWSRAAEELLGFRREEALGRELAGLIIPPELRARHREGLAAYLRGGPSTLIGQRTEMVALDSRGTRIPVELAVTRIADADPPIFTGSLRDIRGRSEAERARAHLAAIAADSQDAVMAKDLEGRVTAWNRGAEQIYGYAAREAIGRHISFIVPPDHAGEEQRILDRIRAGERVETYETERVRKDGVRIDVALTVSPIVDPILGVTGASIVARDITAERRRRSAREFLARSTRAFDASLEPRQTARAIVEAAVPELADICGIDMLLPDGSIGDATVGARDPAIGERLEAIRTRAPIDPTSRHPVAEVIRTRRPVVVRHLDTPEVRSRVALNDEHAELIVAAGYTSAAVVPMFARGRLLGALSFLHGHSDRRYDEADLTLLADIAGRAALALDNAYLYRERDAIARTLQAGLRPEAPARIPGVEVAVVFDPAGAGIEVGGDFYDVFRTPRGWLVVIGDVVGKGSEAATLTAQIRHTLRALARHGSPPGRIVADLNAILWEDTPRERFATLQLLELRGEGPMAVELVSAGHPPAAFASGGGAVRQLGGGTILGVLSEARLAAAPIELAPGDTLVLYTDGWLDAGSIDRHRTPEELAEAVGQRRALALETLLDELRGDALERAAGTLDDDLVILGIRPAPVRQPSLAAG
jgi:PAS domain S-box-containing protein